MLERLQLKIIVILSVIFLPISQSNAVTVLNTQISTPFVHTTNSTITHRVTIQPIIVSDNDGSNRATFFGNSNQQIQIESFIDDIWSQAGIDIDFLNINTWNNSFANNGNTSPRPNSDLNTIVNDANLANITHVDPDIINMFFVQTPAGFNPLSENSAAGLAFVNGNGSTNFVGSNLLDFTQGRTVIAEVIAHEIGHNLGLFHTQSGIDNLMSPNGTGDTLNGQQINTALDSRFSSEIVSAVPVPAAVWLFGTGLLGLLSFPRRMLPARA